MKLRWTRRALADFEQAHDHIAQDNPEAARQVAQRILDATEALLEYPISVGLAKMKAPVNGEGESRKGTVTPAKSMSHACLKPGLGPE